MRKPVTNTTFTMQKYFNIIISTACIVLAFMLFKSCQKNQDGEQFQKMYVASHDSLRSYIDEDGLHVSEINVLQGSMSNLKSLITGTDSALRRLQILVTKNTTSATILLSATHSQGSSATTATGRDTIRKDSLIYIYPQYTSKWNEKWSKGRIIANKDSVYRDFTTFNDFELSQEWEKQKVAGKWFKQNILVSKVTNKNPNTETVNLKTFSKEEPKQHRLLTFAIVSIAGSVTGIYIDSKLHK